MEELLDCWGFEVCFVEGWEKGSTLLGVFGEGEGEGDRYFDVESVEECELDYPGAHV